MKIAINQPYFLPYLGYFQLIAAADLFVAYENVAYTRKSWISRNRLQGRVKKPYFISLPTVKASSGTLIRDVYLHGADRQLLAKLLRRIRIDYAQARCFGEVIEELEEMFMTAPRSTLFAFNNHCLKWMCSLLKIKTRLSLEHDELLDFEAELTSGEQSEFFDVKSERVFGLMSHFGANHYLNLSGGVALYGYDKFGENGFALDFLNVPNVEYPQFEDSFTPHLSILDTLLHCGVEHTRSLIYDFKFQPKPYTNISL